MTWSRQVNKLERLALDVLRTSEKPLSLREIVDAVNNVSPHAFSGKTPTNSLYSILYRSQKRRIDSNLPPILNVSKVEGKIFYEYIE